MTQKIIVVDPGHGGKDPGAVYAGIKEKELNLLVAKKLKEKLKGKGFNVIMTRETDTDVSLQKRGEIAKNANADLFLSIHFNGYNSIAKGAEVIYSYGSENSKRVAEIFLDEIVKLGITKRTVYTKKSEFGDYNYYGVLRHSYPITAIIVEPLFLTNPEDRKILEQKNFIDNLAEAYTKATCLVFNKLNWKQEIVQKAYNLGLLNSDEWIEKAEEKADVWFVCAMAINAANKK